MEIYADLLDNGVKITAVTLDSGNGKINDDFLEYVVLFKKVKSELLSIDEEKMVVVRKMKNGKFSGEDGKAIWIPRRIFQKMQCHAHNLLFPKKDSSAALKQKLKLPLRQNFLF